MLNEKRRKCESSREERNSQLLAIALYSMRWRDKLKNYCSPTANSSLMRQCLTLSCGWGKGVLICKILPLSIIHYQQSSMHQLLFEVFVALLHHLLFIQVCWLIRALHCVFISLLLLIWGEPLQQYLDWLLVVAGYTHFKRGRKIWCYASIIREQSCS